MSGTNVLLLGGHGKISMLLTPLLLKRSWNVTSLVRNADHTDEILALGKGQPGKLKVVVESLEDLKNEAEARKIVDSATPEIVVWCAGAGGKGGPSRTRAVDLNAAKLMIHASVNSPNVKKFMMVSYIGSRRASPPWWSQADIDSANEVNTKVLPAYFAAKVEADEYLAALAHQRQGRDKSFQAINLRPGTLTDKPAGSVLLGKTPSRGPVPRASVAAVAAELLVRDDTRGWYDLIEGSDSVENAVEAAVKDGHDSIEGEDLERIHAIAA